MNLNLTHKQFRGSCSVEMGTRFNEWAYVVP